MTKEEQKKAYEVNKAYEDKLKPCPFCGGKARLYTRLGLWWVSCASLREKCNLECHTKMYELPDMAVKSWNKRGKAEWKN